MNSDAQTKVLLGIGLVALATLFFASSDVLTKHLVAVYSVTLIGVVRYLVNLGLLAAIWGPKHGRLLWRTRRTGLVVLRGLCLTAATLTMGLALKVMPVGETVAIVYLAPIGVMIVAWLLLGESVSRAGWAGAALGFAGVLLIVRPGTGLVPLGVALALTNAALSTVYHVLTRILAKTETTMALMFHAALVGVVAFGGLLAFEPAPKLPGAYDFALMVLLGCTLTAGHFLFTQAYRQAPAALLAPVNYMHLAWAGLLGWLVFGHLPDAVTGLGMAMVVIAGVAVALRAHFGASAPAFEGET